MKNNPFRIFWIFLGFICLGFGSIGIVLPILPTVPFYMATLFCFAKGSTRLHQWFMGTKVYKKHLESFVQKREMTFKTKLTIITTVTVLMILGFVMMRGLIAGQICLFIVWIFHLLYFFVRIKTVKPIEENL